MHNLISSKGKNMSIKREDKMRRWLLDANIIRIKQKSSDEICEELAKCCSEDCYCPVENKCPLTKDCCSLVTPQMWKKYMG